MDTIIGIKYFYDWNVSSVFDWRTIYRLSNGIRNIKRNEASTLFTGDRVNVIIRQSLFAYCPSWSLTTTIQFRWHSDPDYHFHVPRQRDHVPEWLLYDSLAKWNHAIVEILYHCSFQHLIDLSVQKKIQEDSMIEMFTRNRFAREQI